MTSISTTNWNRNLLLQANTIEIVSLSCLDKVIDPRIKSFGTSKFVNNILYLSESERNIIIPLEAAPFENTCKSIDSGAPAMHFLFHITQSLGCYESFVT